MIRTGKWAHFLLHFPVLFGILCCSVLGCATGPLPDLMVAISTVPASPVNLTDTWNVTVKVINAGASPAAASVLRYQITNTITSQVTNVDVSVPSLPSGASFTDSYAGTYAGRVGSNASAYSFLVTANAGGTVSESDETNNTASFSLVVLSPGLPDLTVAVSTVPVSPVNLTDMWSVTVKVTNGGASSAAASVLRYRITNALTNQVTNVDVSVPVLLSSASFTDSYAGTYGVRVGSNPGTNSFLVTADAGGTVSEADETNNTASFSLPIIYPELVIDTYYPMLSGAGLTIGTDALYLFDSTGELSPALATVITGTSPDGDQASYAYIDYTGGLAPGVYYVRIQARNGTSAGAYAIVILTAPLPLPRDASWFFPESPGANTADSPYEADDTLSSGVPTNPAIISVGGKLNRYVALSGDIDWVKVTLP